MTDKTPPPTTVDPGDLPERRRRSRAADTTPPPELPPIGAPPAIAAWNAEFPFEGATDSGFNVGFDEPSGLSDLPALPDVSLAAEPPPPDSDLVLDVTDEPADDVEPPTPGPDALAAGEAAGAAVQRSEPARATPDADEQVEIDVDLGQDNGQDHGPDSGLGLGGDTAGNGHALRDAGPGEKDQRPRRVIPKKGDAFDRELPTEPSRFSDAAWTGPPGARLDLGFGPSIPELDARAIAGRLNGSKAAPAGDAFGSDAPLLAHELAEALEGSASPTDIAALAVAAGRAAETTHPEEAIPHYRQALAVEPGYAPGLRALLRLELRQGNLPAALAAAAGLADAVVPDQRAYQALLDEAVSSGATPVTGGETPAPPADATAALLRAAESALRGESDSTAATACERLGDHLGGGARVALRTFAAMLRQLDGQVPEVRALTGAAGVNGEGAKVAEAFLDLRAALALPPDQALPRVTAALEALPSSPLSPALLRWAARLARSTGDGRFAQQLLERARASGARFLPALEGIDVVSADVGDSLPALIDRLVGLPNDVVALLAGRLADALLGAGRVGDALAILGHAVPRDLESGPALAPLLSRILAAPAESAFHEEARALLMTADPARSAEVSLQATLAALWNASDEHDDDALAAHLSTLGAAAHDRADPALFWWQSWHLRARGQLDAAAEALAASAAGFAPTLPEVTQALLARAAVLTASTDLASYAGTLAVGRLAESDLDDPADLARALLDGEADPGSFTERFATAGKNGNPHRLFEAAGWAVQAGEFGKALAILAAAPSDVRASETGARFLFRLMRLGTDPAAAAALLRERAEATTDLQQQALFAHLAAESLERAGQRADAAVLYRELLASPLAKDADLALRRALLMQKDAPGLLDFWRDEFDASSGAGKNRDAALASLQKARVVRDFTENQADAAAEVATALSLAPDLLPARVLALCQPHPLTGDAARLAQIESLADVVPPQAPQVLYLAGLLADAEGEQ
ncbi:MAG TPA: hypothetical protein VGG33_07670, partial [Polyangia bacterium]